MSKKKRMNRDKQNKKAKRKSKESNERLSQQDKEFLQDINHFISMCNPDEDVMSVSLVDTTLYITMDSLRKGLLGLNLEERANLMLLLLLNLASEKESNDTLEDIVTFYVTKALTANLSECTDDILFEGCLIGEVLLYLDDEVTSHFKEFWFESDVITLILKNGFEIKLTIDELSESPKHAALKVTEEVERMV